MVFDAVQVGLVRVLNIEVAVEMLVIGQSQKLEKENLRLTTQGVIGTAREFTVNRPDLLGNVSECLVEEVGPRLHHGLKLFLGLSCRLPGVLEVLFGAAKFVLDTLQALHGTRIRRHLVEVAVENTDLFEQFILELVIGLL